MVTAFKKAEGVVDATTNFPKKTATVIYDPTKTNPQKLTEALKDTGFSAALPAATDEKKDGTKEGEKSAG